MKNVAFIFVIMMSLSASAQKTGSTWKLLYVREAGSMVNISSKKAGLLLSIPDNTLSGSIGCNTFTGNLNYLKGDKIKPIKLVNTTANCPPKPDKLDNAVLEALKSADKLVLNQDKAKFYKGETLVLEMNR
jgi:heat shock protein HslJ